MPKGAAGPEPRLFGHPPFLLYFGGRALSEFAAQVGTVAVGWQVYALTGSAFDLGLIGLVQFIPTALLVFFAGHVADRFDRKRVVQACQTAEGLTAAVLAWGSIAGWLNAGEIFAAVAVLGVAMAFESPAASAMLAGVAPEGSVQRATATATALFPAASIIGPALGGVAFGVAPGLPYAAMAAAWLLAGTLNGAVRLVRPPAVHAPPTLGHLFDGVGFVRRNPAILGTISLDLFVVLLGGATALLPIYARDILGTGPWGLGVLRAAPAVGALAMTVLLANRGIERRAGLRMFQAVIVFGLATAVFAVSRSLWLSLAALAVLGAADAISMVIRGSLVLLATPDEMRGRVGAVNFLFINASNELGQFESGMAAALFGAVGSALIGGIGSILVALLWMALFPSLRKVDRLEAPRDAAT